MFLPRRAADVGWAAVASTGASAKAPGVSTLFTGAAPGSPRFLSSRFRPGWREPDSAPAPDHRLMLETLASVAPSSQDKQLLKQMMKEDRTAELGFVRPAAPPATETIDLVDDPLEALEGTYLRHRYDWRSSHSGERLLARFADELSAESNERLAPIRLEAQLFRINSRRDFPVDENNLAPTQRFVEAYVERRGSRALYSAIFKTVKRTAIIEDTYEHAVAFRNQYMNFSASYGGYEKETVRDDAEASMGELAEEKKSQFVPDETIEEELARKRLSAIESGLNPFKKGRVSLRASIANWVELVWKTPTIEVKAAPKKVRVRVGGKFSGLDISSYASAQYSGWKGRSGFEIARPIDLYTRIRLNAGINFGRERRVDGEDLVDWFALTNDASYVYLAFERLF